MMAWVLAWVGRHIVSFLPSPLISSLLQYFLPTSLRHPQSFVPNDKNKENILAKATLRFSLRDNVSSLLFNLSPCLYILSDYGLAFSGSYTIIVSQQQLQSL